MMNANEFEIKCPDDMHLHLRQGEALINYVSDAKKYFKRAVIMPNTLPPIDSPESVKKYKAEIESTQKGFEALMTFKIHNGVSADQVKSLKEAGCIGGKIYPAGVTTHSEDGVSEIDSFFPVFAEMMNHDLILNIHAEEPTSFSLDRERDYLPKVKKIMDAFPKLRIVIEHLSDRASVEFVKEAPETVAATLTVHHLDLTLDSIIGGNLRPHNFCKPVPKTPADRDSLRAAAFSGNPKFFLGTDSAPHLKNQKESDCGCAGIYSAPVALPVLIEIFEAAGCLDKLESFTSKYGSQFYQMPQNQDSLLFVKKTWTVPLITHGVVPYRAGQSLNWNLV